MVPLLELQRRQQMATLYFLPRSRSLLKCLIVGPQAVAPRFIKIPQYTQVLSLARISCSTCLGIPYMLDTIFSDRSIRHFELVRTRNTILRYLKWLVEVDYLRFGNKRITA